MTMEIHVEEWDYSIVGSPRNYAQLYDKILMASKHVLLNIHSFPLSFYF